MKCRCAPGPGRCGRCPDAIDEWWINFGLFWNLLAYELTTQTGYVRPNKNLDRLSWWDACRMSDEEFAEYVDDSDAA